jgi:hypothetical protein
MSVQLYAPETRFAVASLPLAYYREVLEAVSNVEGFVSVTRDKEEVTLVMAEDLWRQMAGRFPAAEVVLERRLIRFDTVLDFSVVGFIAEISKALAEAGISILSISTYRTDAVLVHESRFSDAVAAVKRALITLNYTHLSQL